MVLIRTKFKGPSRFCYYYLITNLLTGWRYVGSRTINGKNPLDDTGYMGSSVPLKNDIEKYGISNFSKAILRHERFVGKVTICLNESKYMRQYQTLRPNGYNQYDPGKYPGFSNSGIKMSEELKKKYRVAQNRPEVRAKRSASMNRPEVKAKQRASLKIAQNRPEVKAKRSASMKKRWQDPEVKAKYSASLKKAMNRPEVRAKISASKKQYHTTHKPKWLIHLEEYRKTLAETGQCPA